MHTCSSERSRRKEKPQRLQLLLTSIAWCGLWLALASPSLALNPTSRAGDYTIHGWFTEDGLGSNKIRAIVQARDGYLWLATAQGIARFDGSRFTIFNPSAHPHVGTGEYFSALEAPDGALWFGGELGLVRWRQGRFERFTTKEGLAHDYVRGLALTRDGTVVACTRDGYSFFRNGRFTTPGGIWNEARGVARSYLERADGSILLGTSVGLWRIVGEKVERLSGTADFPGNGFITLLETPDRSAWVGYSAGLRRLLPDGRTEHYGPAQGLTSPRVAALSLDREGHLWIAASGSLYRMAKDRIEPADYSAQLKGTTINHLREDREGNLWIATVTGLFRLKDNVSHSISVAEGLAHTTAQTVLETSDGAWWIGAWHGGVYRYDQSRAVRVPGLAPLDLDRVYSFAAAPDNTLWIGSESGLHRFADGKLTNLHHSSRAAEWEKLIAQNPDTVLPGLAHNWVTSVAIDARGDIWAATDGALYHGNVGRFRAYTKAHGLAGDEILSVACARNGDVWAVAPPHGVSRWRDGKWTNYLCGEALSANRPLGVFEDASGAIWVTTHGGGLNRFHEGRWRTYTTRDGLAHDSISGIIDDTHGFIWVAYPGGVMRIPKGDFSEVDKGQRAALRSRIFNSSDGLPRGDATPIGTPNVWRTRDGRLLFATDLGVAVIDPSRVRFNNLEPPVHIERLMLNRAEVDFSKPVSIAPGPNDLQIHFTALSLPAPEKVRFKIRLAPLDRDWVDNGAGHDVHYAKLPAGNYTFHVKACNNDGVWNEEGAALKFTVRPFFYQTPWFVSLVALTIGLGGLGFYRQRNRRARRRMEVLSRQVAERTSDLQTAKERAESAVAALERAQAEIADERARFKFIFEAVPVGISLVRPGEEEIHLVNPAHMQITGLSATEVRQPGAFDRVTHPDDAARQRPLLRKYRAGEIDHFTLEKRYLHPGGKVVWATLTRRMFIDPATGIRQSITTLVDITERKEAEARLAESHRQLLDISRQAGMAEVATGVLHNVGNVLNSVNVSATLVSDKVRGSKTANLIKLGEMLRERESAGDLTAFLVDDPKGRQIPGYLIALADQVAAERQLLADELEQLRKSIDHIKEIVAMQQSYAKVSGVTETVAVTDLVEDALRINAAGLARHGLEVVRDYEPGIPPVPMERHKVLQVLVNLIRNAKQACDETGRSDKRLTVRIVRDGARIRVSFADNGVGISPENLTRIFAHGFTTKREGHGFGLHSGALVARELGGSLSAHSDGIGTGATFTLELPFRPESA